MGDPETCPLMMPVPAGPRTQRAARLLVPASLAWPAIALAAAGLVMVPVGAVLVALFTPSVEVWRHLWATRLWEYTRNTLVLLAGVGLGTFLLGTWLAWLVVAYRFPGRDVLEWLLILPLAVPGYVMAFVFFVAVMFVRPQGLFAASGR